MFLEEQADKGNTFIAHKGNISFYMAVIPTGDENSLRIILRNYDINDEYCLLLTQKSIESDQQFRNIFSEPEQLFDELRDNFDRVQLRPNGVIELQVKIRGKKRAGIKLILEKQHIIIEEKSQSVQIKNLVLMIKEIQLESNIKNEKLQRRVTEFQQVIAAQSQQTSSLKQEISSLKRELNEIKHYINRQSLEIRKFRQEQKMFYNQNKKKEKEQNIVISSLNFYPQSHETQKCYTIDSSSKKIQRSNHLNGQWYSLIFKQCIKQSKVNKIQFMLVNFDNVGHPQLEIGITTRQNFGLASTRRNENQACYCLSSDNVWIENEKHEDEEETEPFKNYQFVGVIVNMIYNKIIFFRRKTLEEQIRFIDEQPLPKSMRDRSLFFSLTMRKAGSSVILVTE